MALKECFKRLDDDYKEGKAGTTTAVALIIDNQLWIANVGDSRAVLVKHDGTAIQASEDAKPRMFSYKRKIEEAGGFVSKGRVNEILGVARAIGDKHIVGKTGNKCVLPNPKITSYPLDSFDYLVLACDGFFDIASTNELGFAMHDLHITGKETREMAKTLVYSAIDGSLCIPIINSPSQDNVSIIVVKK